jgi:hypothetical protein
LAGFSCRIYVPEKLVVAITVDADLRIFFSPYAAAARIASYRSTRIRLLALGKEISVLFVVNRATDTLVGPQ